MITKFLAFTAAGTLFAGAFTSDLPVQLASKAGKSITTTMDCLPPRRRAAGSVHKQNAHASARGRGDSRRRRNYADRTRPTMKNLH